MSARLFGKLPAHGDFVDRNPTPSDGLRRVQRALADRWLTAMLVAAQAAHGDAFAERYDRAPPWRFALDDGRGGRAGGALALSQDAAGRRYPLYAELQPLYRGEPVPAAAAVEDRLYQAIAGRWTADALADALNALVVPCEHGPGDNPQALDGGRWWLADGPADATLIGYQPPELIDRMLAVVA